MLYRDTVDDRRIREQEQRDFVPLFCPYKACPSHACEKFEFVRNGWHETKRAPFRVQRFRCEVCSRTFSTQTFKYDYWQKRPDLDRLIFVQARGCSGNRQIAAAVECGKSTVAEKLTRLARHSLRFFVRAMQLAPRLKGDLLFDGLGTFEHDQYNPYWLNVAVHRDTSLVLGFTDSPLRRSGRMTASQKLERARLESRSPRPDPRAIRIGTADLLRAIRPLLDLDAIRFVTDEHHDYPRALRDAGLETAPHLRVPGSDQRTPMNPLFEINLADMNIRHGSSNQKRETIAFNKRRQAGLEKGWVWALWKNFMAPRRAKHGKRGSTPAMLAGIAPQRLNFTHAFEMRIFSFEADVPAAWQRHIGREILTPRIGRNRTFEPVFIG